MNVPTITQIQSALKNKGYQYLNDGKLYHLNIIGIRSSSPLVDSFNDLICLLYNDEMGQKFKYMACTTKPGSYYLEHPDNPLGVAILVPNQYLNSFATGLHHGQYKCLVQTKTLQLYRDNDKKDAFDYEHITPGGVECGIHIHHASNTGTSTVVYNWSAGCQVCSSIDSFNVLMELVEKSIIIRGDVFTYTLLNELDLT